MADAPHPEAERLGEVLAAYLEAEDAGWAPPRQAFVTRYPGLAADLANFFASQDHIVRLTGSPPNGAGPPDRPPAAGLSFGDYKVIEEIRSGGMGVVYKAWQKGPARFVALKMILAGSAASPEEVRRFRTEAEAAANLDHPHIVPIY
jgi:serine/threonine protein kinase